MSMIINPYVFGGIPSSALSPIALFDSATSTASTVTCPSGTAAGDLIVLVDYAKEIFSTPSAVTPSGFTQIATVVGQAADRFSITKKIAVGGESGATITGMSGADVENKVIMVFRGAAAIASATDTSLSSGNTGGDPTALAVSISSPTGPLIVFGAYASSGSVSTRTFSPSADAELSAGTNMYVKYKILNSGDATPSYTVDMGDNGGSNIQVAFYHQLA